MLTVLFDGWALARQPSGPAARHLHTLLAGLGGEARAIVALPAPPVAPLPAGAEALVQPAAGTPAARLNWEQRTLPGLARKTGAAVQHIVTAEAALQPACPVLYSPTGAPGSGRAPGFAARLRLALAAGGMARLAGILWPADLPAPERPEAPLLRLPPLIEPRHGADGNPTDELPEAYILYAGPGDEASLRRLAEAWSWAAGAVGGSYPLLVAGLEPGEATLLDSLWAPGEMKDSLRILPPDPGRDWRRLVQGCTVFFHPAHPEPWGGLLRLALAGGRPVVALDEPLTGAITGPAGYLAPASDPRKLGAALISLIVDENLADRLAGDAARQAAAWTGAGFGEELLKIYHQAAGA